MAINRWLGIAQPRVAKQALQPLNVTPGSTWVLRVGSQSYTYEYPASIETANLTEAEMAEAVTDGLVSEYSGGALLAGGAADIVGSVTSELFNGRWSIVVTGSENGAPLDVELTGSDPIASSISVVRLQAGRSAQNEIQRIKFPATPTGGTWFVRYKNAVTSALAHNITAANLQTALRALSSIGSSNVNVSGSHTAGYTVEFVGALAGLEADTLVAFSNDFTGTAAYKLDVTTKGGIGRQEYTMSKLSGDANSQFRFVYEGEEGHLFTGAATVALLTTALESIESIGAGNVFVQQNDNGSYTITLVGAFVGREGGTLGVENVATGVSTSLESSAVTFESTQTVLLITILNMPSNGSGTFTLSYGGLTTAGIPFVSAASAINTALGTAGISDWSCTEVTGGDFGAYTIELTSASGKVDAGVVLPNVSGLVGCNAIDVRTTQQARRARNEVQQINIETNPTGGTFTLAFGANTTAGLAFNASAAAIQTALQGLASIGSGNAIVSGPVAGPFIVEFTSSLGSASQGLIVGNGSNLTLPVVAGVSEVNVLTPTGPNWWTNPGNWSLGTVPSSSDVATFDAAGVDCIYGIQGVPAVAGIDIFRTYTGRIGLPERKDDGSPETLPQYLTLSDNGSTIPIRIGLGDEGAGPSIVRINTASQDADVSLLFSAIPGGDQLYTVGLAGSIAILHAADCSLQIATAANLSATVALVRVSPRNKADDGAVVEWGENAVVVNAEIVAGTVRMGSVPSNLTIDSGQVSVRGSGNLNTLSLRNSQLRYLAGGSLGKFGTVSALTTSGGVARLTSNNHGLSSGDRIFLRGVVGVVGLPDGVYTITRVDANVFDLIGTAPAIPFGASVPSSVSSYYQSGTAQWGLVDAIKIGADGILDLSEFSISRTIVAPVLLQADTAQVLDPMRTVAGLRIKSDPGYQEAALGNRALIKRE